MDGAERSWAGKPIRSHGGGMIERGAVGFVPKPYRMADLSSAVAAGIAAGERRAVEG